MDKFSLTKNTKTWEGITLYQIKAEISFGNVSKGELGGYIEKEKNLSKKGNAWVYEDAFVYGEAWVYGDAQICGSARIYGEAQISGQAQISGDAHVYGNAHVYGDAWVSGKLKLISGYFFGYKEKKEDLKYFNLDLNYKLIGKGDCKVETEGEKQAELLKMANELIEKAEELKKEAERL